MCAFEMFKHVENLKECYWYHNNLHVYNFMQKYKTHVFM